jgi:hypothetical protein
MGCNAPVARFNACTRRFIEQPELAHSHRPSRDVKSREGPSVLWLFVVIGLRVGRWIASHPEDSRRHLNEAEHWIAGKEPRVRVEA